MGETEIEWLRNEVLRLSTELERAHRRLAELDGAHRGSTVAANAQRAKQSARIDGIVLGETLRLLPSVKGSGSDRERLWYFGFPYFYSQRRFADKVAEHLNGANISAPRGGLWTSRQVKRAWTRQAERMEMFNKEL